MRICLALALLVSLVQADEGRTDPDKPTSPRLPQPMGLAFVKHAHAFDMRTPEGFSLERVADLGPNTRAVVFVDTAAFLLRGGAKDAIVPLKGSTFTPAAPLLEEAGIAAVAAVDGQLLLANSDGVFRLFEGKRERLVQGAGIIGITLGTDGWLYLSTTEGDTTLTGRDGSKASIRRSGAIFRCTPQGDRLHRFALGTRHVAGPLAFDLAGQAFALDADLPEAGRFTGCRLLHLADAGDYGYRLAPGAKAGKPDPDRAAAWGEAPGTLRPLLKTGRGEPAGLFTYHDTQLPERYRGLLFYPDPRDRTVRAYRVEPQGATFRPTEEFTLLTGLDAFCPVGLAVGPEGALYVVDRGEDKGILWRLHWKGTDDEDALPLRDPAKRPDFTAEADALKGLSAADASERQRARTALRQRGSKARSGLLAVLADEKTSWTARMMALGCLLPLEDADVRKGLLDKLGNSDAEVQRLAAEALGIFMEKSADKDGHAALLRALGEEDAPLRRAVALSMGRLAHPGAGDNLAATLSFDNGKCPVLRDGLIRGIEALGKPGITALHTLVTSGSQRDIDAVAELYRGLRSQAAFEGLPELLGNPHLNSEQRAALVRASIRWPGVSLDSIVLPIAGNDKEPLAVKRAALQALATPGVRFGPKLALWAMDYLADGDSELRTLARKIVQARLKAADVGAEEKMLLNKAINMR
jgi:HEAT repeat protein